MWWWGGGSGSSNVAPVSPTPTNYTEVTFDNVTTVPVFASTSTRTTVFVHNYSSHKITNIVYTASTDDTTRAQLRKVSKDV